MKSTSLASTNPFAITSTSPASTNPFAGGMQEDVRKEESKALSANHSNVELGALSKKEANDSTNPFHSKLTEQKEETKPFIPSSEPDPSNEKHTSPVPGNEKPA